MGKQRTRVRAPRQPIDPSLTAEERRELKRERNRLAAQRNRDRHKIHRDELEGKCRMLDTEKEGLNARVKLLEESQSQLRSDIMLWQKILQFGSEDPTLVDRPEELMKRLEQTFPNGAGAIARQFKAQQFKAGSPLDDSSGYDSDSLYNGASPTSTATSMPSSDLEAMDLSCFQFPPPLQQHHDSSCGSASEVRSAEPKPQQSGPHHVQQFLLMMLLGMGLTYPHTSQTSPKCPISRTGVPSKEALLGLMRAFSHSNRATALTDSFPKLKLG